MPPKPKFTREEIVESALAIIDEQGIDALTARELAAKLGSSSRPIFTVFEDMEELRAEAREVAARRFEGFVAQAASSQPAILEAGMQVLRFAYDKPHLFWLATMPENLENVSYYDLLSNGHGSLNSRIGYLEEEYGLSNAQAEVLYQHFMLMVYGMAVLVANRSYCFSEEQARRVLNVELRALLDYLCAGHLDDLEPAAQRVAPPPQ